MSLPLAPRTLRSPSRDLSAGPRAPEADRPPVQRILLAIALVATCLVAGQLGAAPVETYEEIDLAANEYGDLGQGYESSYSYVRVLDGGATLLQDDGDRESLELHQPLLAGDRILVGPDSRLELILSDFSRVRLDGGSELYLESLAASPETAARQTLLRLERGNLQIVVPSDVLGDSDIRVDTPNATAYLGIDGTYRITADQDDWTSLVVRRGAADLVTREETLRVEAGREGIADGTYDLHQEVRTASRLDSLELWSEDLDRGVRTASSSSYVDDTLGYQAASLDDHGTWVTVGSSHAWRPRVASDWRPYWHGRWHHSPLGLTWVSSEPWGWVPYHYGTWDYAAGYGWVWFPGRRFAPAWVYWSWNDSYVGWVPAGYYTRHWGPRFGVDVHLRFGTYGWARGSWDHYDRWVFCEPRYLGYRHQGRYARTYDRLPREVRRAGPRGILTTDTRGVTPERLRRRGDVLDAIAGGAERRARLADVTPFVARGGELDRTALSRVAVERSARDLGDRAASRRAAVDRRAPILDPRAPVTRSVDRAERQARLEQGVDGRFRGRGPAGERRFDDGDRARAQDRRGVLARSPEGADRGSTDGGRIDRESSDRGRTLRGQIDRERGTASRSPESRSPITRSPDTRAPAERRPTTSRPGDGSSGADWRTPAARDRSPSRDRETGISRPSDPGSSADRRGRIEARTPERRTDGRTDSRTETRTPSRTESSRPRVDRSPPPRERIRSPRSAEPSTGSRSPETRSPVTRSPEVRRSPETRSPETRSPSTRSPERRPEVRRSTPPPSSTSSRTPTERGREPRERIRTRDERTSPPPSRSPSSRSSARTPSSSTRTPSSRPPSERSRAAESRERQPAPRRVIDRVREQQRESSSRSRSPRSSRPSTPPPSSRSPRASAPDRSRSSARSSSPTRGAPTTRSPSRSRSTRSPSTRGRSTRSPSRSPSTRSPSTRSPSTRRSSPPPSTRSRSSSPSTRSPSSRPSTRRSSPSPSTRDRSSRSPSTRSRSSRPSTRSRSSRGPSTRSSSSRDRSSRSSSRSPRSSRRDPPGASTP